MAQLKYNTQTSTSAYEGLPNCTFSAVTTRKPDRLYEITVFRDWTTEGLGLWSVEQENRLMSPMIAGGSLLPGGSFQATAQEGETQRQPGSLVLRESEFEVQGV